MSAKDTGLKLWDDAYKILNARLQTDDATYHRIAQQKAVEISDFLSQEGEDLDKTDPNVVTNLGKAVDALASGVQDTLPAVQASPIGAGVSQFMSDDSSLDEAVAKNAHDFIDKVVKPYKNYLIAGAAVFGLAVIGYTVRAFK